MFISLLLLAGQVQYSYTTYFCTMEHKPVKQPTVAGEVSEHALSNKICDACQGVIVVYHTEGVAKRNCIRVETYRKNVVDSFAETGSALSHIFAAVATCSCNPGEQAGTSHGLLLMPRCASPPGDISILNSNLRI